MNTGISQSREEHIRNTVYNIIASTLLIPVEHINIDLTYQSIMEWDSIRHVNLMLAIEESFEVRIDQNKVLELTSVHEIISYISNYSKNGPRSTLKKTPKKEVTTISRGLNNIYFDESNITFIDVNNSKLYYRGYSVNDLARYASYEEVAYLLIYGYLPNTKNLAVFKEKLVSSRCLSDKVVSVIRLLAGTQSATNVLRTSVSALCEEVSKLAFEEQGISYLAKIPTIIGMCFAFQNEKKWVGQMPDNLSQAEYLLVMLLGKLPDTDIVRVFEQNMILQAEHESNASTFSARTTMSTETELGNSIVSAMATFSGLLHGGALIGVVEMLNEVKHEDNVKAYIENRLKKKLPIFGFGHRVYRNEDPRAALLKQNAEMLSDRYQNNRLLHILEAIKVEMDAYIKHGININVDFYACVSYLLMSIEKNMLVPIFMANRACGWIAHTLEQRKNNILIRPRLHYVGEINKKFLSIEERI